MLDLGFPVFCAHSDEFSDKKMIITTGILMVVFSTVLTTFIGYNIVS